MNQKYLSKSVTVAAVGAILSYGAGLYAATSPTAQTLTLSAASQDEFQPLAFRDSSEAGMLHRAYRILATGDHAYKGHRAKAMHAVEDAAKLLGLDLSGDAKDKQKQGLSDEKLRESRNLISKVLGSAEVKDQKRVVKHLEEAVNQINLALAIK